MDFDEFEESDVMFSDYSSDQSVENENINPNMKHYCQSDGSKLMVMMNKRKGLKKKPPRDISSRSSSAPLNIPQMNTNTFRYDNDVARYQTSDVYNSNEDDDPLMRVPPHLIVERRDNEEIARSFSPLKGKNLCQVRNSILRMTGFLER